VRVRIALPDGRTSEAWRRSAGCQMVREEPGLQRRPEFRPLRQSLDIAIDHYKARDFDTPLGLFANTYLQQQVRGAQLGLNPLVASYGPAPA